jgi:hypothetical protein
MWCILLFIAVKFWGYIEMATVDKDIADRAIAGEYPEDEIVKIVKYTNAWGGESYGLIFEGESLDRYHASDFVIDPVTYWELKK